MQSSKRLIMKLSVSVLIVAFLGGCKPLFDLFEKKEATKKDQKVVKEELIGTVLLHIDGKPVLTDIDFNQHLAQMLQVNPYFRGVGIDSLPMAIKRKFFDELKKQKVILAWAQKNKVEEKSDFIKEYKRMQTLLKDSLVLQHFEKSIFEDVKVSDAEVKDHFNKNKEKFVKEPGGVAVSGIEFNDDIKATAFYNKVVNKEADFNKLAEKENDKAFKDFGRVNEKPAELGLNVPKEVKEVIFTITKFPAIKKVKAGKKFWVICALDKKSAKYFDYNEIKDQLEGMLKNNKFREVLGKKVDKLTTQFTIDVNEDFFKDKAPALPGMKKGKEKPISAAA